MKILVLGSEGMLGHIVKKYFEEQNYEVYSTTKNKNSQYYYDVVEDITKIKKIMLEIQPEVVINCIGILNKVAEDNKLLAVLINSYLPHYLDSISTEYNYKLIHISTDCVFNGEKGEYTEKSITNANSFYGRSKALGEINNDRNLTIRTSIIGPDQNPDGIGLFQWFMNQSGKINGFSEVIWTGVTTLQLAKCIEQAILKNVTGLCHAVNGKKIDKYSLLCLFNEVFDKKIEILKDTTKKSDKSLISTRKDFTFDIPDYKNMIIEMREWMKSHQELYVDFCGNRKENLK